MYADYHERHGHGGHYGHHHGGCHHEHGYHYDYASGEGASQRRIPNKSARASG